MRSLLLAAAVFASGGVLGAETHTLHLKWVDVREVPQAEVRDGVCVVYAPMRDHHGAIGRLVLRCLERGARAVESPPTGAVLVAWTIHPSREALTAAWYAAFGTPTDPIAGFFRAHADGRCEAHTNGLKASDHEFMHCFLGRWHGPEGDLSQARPGFVFK